MTSQSVLDSRTLAKEISSLALLLPKSQILTLILLARRCKQSGSAEIRMTVRELQEISRLSALTISKALRNLNALGLIEISRNAGPFASTIVVDFELIKEAGQIDFGPVPVRKRTRRAV